MRPLYDATTVRLKSSLTTWRRSVLQRFTAVDIVTLLYVAVATAAVLVFSGHDHASWDLLLTAHVLLVTLVLVAPLARQSGPLGRFLGDWYPMLLLGALYAEVGVLNVDLGYQHDQVIQRLELWVFGSQLSYRWIREMPNPLLSWFLHGCYLAYYAILYASPLGLWFSGRRDAARRTIDNAATAVWPARATQWLLDLGDSWGAAFPSSHVAAAVVAALCALRYWRPLGLLLTPFTVGLVLSVVYGQFHYAVDAVAGLIVACAVLASQFIYASQPAAVAAALPGRELETGRA